MIPYWFSFIIPSLFSIFVVSKVPKSTNLIIVIFFLVIISIISGLRYEVGGDWHVYLKDYNQMIDKEIMNVLYSFNFGFNYLLVLSNYLDIGINGLNLIVSIFFVISLFCYIKDNNDIYLSLVIASPYLITFVLMGYTKQIIAISFLMIAIHSIKKQQFIKFTILILLGSTFHFWILFFLPFIIYFNFVQKNLVLFGFIALIFFIIILLLSFTGINIIFENYANYPVKSSGAFFRILMNFFSALAFLLFYKKFINDSKQFNFLILFSLYSFIFFIAFLFTGFSTMFDRISLYLIPMQITIFSNLPYFFNNFYETLFLKISIILFYGLFLFIMLNYGVNADQWLPYDLKILFYE